MLKSTKRPRLLFPRIPHGDRVRFTVSDDSSIELSSEDGNVLVLCEAEFYELWKVGNTAWAVRGKP